MLRDKLLPFLAWHYLCWNLEFFTWRVYNLDLLEAVVNVPSVHWRGEVDALEHVLACFEGDCCKGKGNQDQKARILS